MKSIQCVTAAAISCALCVCYVPRSIAQQLTGELGLSRATITLSGKQLRKYPSQIQLTGPRRGSDVWVSTTIKSHRK